MHVLRVRSYTVRIKMHKILGCKETDASMIRGRGEDNTMGN